MNRRKLLKLSGIGAVSSLFGLNELTAGQNPASGSSEVKKSKIMIFGAHPDDPETGCGGLMTIFAKAGHRVVAVYLTKGEAGIMGKSHKESADIRVKEAEAACEIMGIDCMFLTQIDGSTEINSQRYKEVYDALIGEKPDILFTHWPIDTHRDHRICSVLVYDAWLRMNEKPQLYYYEVMTGKQSQNFYPTDYCDITSVIDIKHKACFVHASQNIEAEYHLDHGKMEEFRGLEYGCRFAEAFIRHVQSPDGRLK